MKAKFSKLIKQLDELQIRESELIETINKISNTESPLNSNTAGTSRYMDAIVTKIQSALDRYGKQLKIGNRVYLIIKGKFKEREGTIITTDTINQCIIFRTATGKCIR